MTLESFLTGVLTVGIILLGSAVAGVLLSLVFGGAVALGMRLREGITGKRKQRKNPQMNSRQPEVQPELPKDILQPASAQQRLYEIEESIFWATGAIQANPMSPGATSLSEQIQRLEQEKRELLKKMADDMDRITIQKVWNTFLPEQQEKFQERIYQYEQDVNRGGTDPKIAAANRGLRIVNGSPVPREVTQRLDEMRQAASLKDAEEI